MSKITSIVTPIAVSDSRTQADSWMPKYDTAITPAPRIAAQRIQLSCSTVAECGDTSPKKFCSRNAAATSSAGTKTMPTASTVQPAKNPVSRPSPARTIA